jgi:D-alanyl-D-alanine carboxypeptidase (penicillin-binding protein 5/6)
MLNKRFCTYLLIVFSLLLLPGRAEALEISAKSAVLMDADSGRVLYEKNSHERLPQASTTKITSAILAIEKGNFKDKVKISKYAAETGGSAIWLETGEVLTLEQLVYAMLLNSANDATMAVAEHIGGSEKNFVRMMNAFAEKVGAKDTHYVNPHGLHDDNHYSSAYDLALLGRYAMQNPTFEKIVATKKRVIPWAGHEWSRLLINKNKFIENPDLYPGADGIKNGFTTPAGYCLVASATRNGMRLIAVVMDCPGATDEIEKMFDYGFNNYKRTLLFSRGETIDRLHLEEKKTDLGLVSAEPFYAALQQDEAGKVDVEVTVPENISLPIKKGSVCGKAVCKVDGRVVGMVNLMASESVDKPGFLASFWQFMVKLFSSLG